MTNEELEAIRKRNEEHKRGMAANPFLRTYIDGNFGPHWPTNTRQIEDDIDALLAEVERLRNALNRYEPDSSVRRWIVTGLRSEFRPCSPNCLRHGIYVGDFIAEEHMSRHPEVMTDEFPHRRAEG